jgi:hypothetical protein
MKLTKGLLTCIFVCSILFNVILWFQLEFTYIHKNWLNLFNPTIEFKAFYHIIQLPLFYILFSLGVIALIILIIVERK